MANYLRVSFLILLQGKKTSVSASNSQPLFILILANTEFQTFSLEIMVQIVERIFEITYL